MLGFFEDYLVLFNRNLILIKLGYLGFRWIYFGMFLFSLFYIVKL